MKQVTLHEAALLVFLAAMILLPLGLVSILAGPATPPEPAGDEAVKAVLERNGIMVDSVQEVWLNIPGARGGNVYSVTDADGRTSRVMTQDFDSDASRDAAIRSWHAAQPGRGGAYGHLFVTGRQIIIVAPADRPVLQVIGREMAAGRLV